MGPHRIGALAGLVPAVVALVLFVVLGGAPSREAILWLAAIALLAVSVGWLVGPLAAGSLQADLRASIAFAVLGSLAYLLVGTVGSVWTDPGTGGDAGLGPLSARIGGQILYGLLYLPFWAGWIAPFALAWVVAVRVLRRRAGLAHPGPSADGARDAAPHPAAMRTRRMGLVAAALISVYGLFVAVLPLILYDDPRPPWSAYRPVSLFGLFAVPAVVAAIGAIWARRSLLVAAGVVCLLQSLIAFSGVTVGFMIPAILLLALGGGERWPTNAHGTRTALVAGVAVVALTFGAWVATIGLTEEVCWRATPNSDGSLAYERVPASDTMTLIPGQAAAGCDGGSPTVEGIALGTILAVGAIAVAAASVWTSRDDVVRG